MCKEMEEEEKKNCETHQNHRTHAVISTWNGFLIANV